MPELWSIRHTTHPTPDQLARFPELAAIAPDVILHPGITIDRGNEDMFIAGTILPGDTAYRYAVPATGEMRYTISAIKQRLHQAFRLFGSPQAVLDYLYSEAVLKALPSNDVRIPFCDLFTLQLDRATHEIRLAHAMRLQFIR